MYQFGMRIEQDMTLTYICLDCARSYTDLDTFAVECMGAPLVCSSSLLRQAKSIMPTAQKDESSEERTLEHYMSLNPMIADQEWRRERVCRQLFNPLSVHQRTMCSFVTHISLPSNILGTDPVSVWALIKAALGAAKEVWVSSDNGKLATAVRRPIMEHTNHFMDAYCMSVGEIGNHAFPTSFKPMDQSVPVPVALHKNMMGEFEAYSSTTFAARLDAVREDMRDALQSRDARPKNGTIPRRLPSKDNLIRLMRHVARSVVPTRCHAYWWLYNFYAAMACGSYHIKLSDPLPGYTMNEMYREIVPLVFKHMKPWDFIYSLGLPRLDPMLDKFCANVQMLAPEEYTLSPVPSKLRVWAYGLTKGCLVDALKSMGACIESAPRSCIAAETRILRALCKKYSCIVGTYDMIIKS